MVILLSRARKQGVFRDFDHGLLASSCTSGCSVRFVFMHVMRSFDGFHYIYNKPKINYTLIGAFPTRGVFQVDGWGWMKTGFAYASATGLVQAGKNTGEWRVFGIYYHDWRRILKQDNRPVPVRTLDAGNVRLGTYGAHLGRARSPRRHG
ncbi:MAG: hypothetical protein ACRD8O_11725 [Bryobacteraceae bacterium]